ncbi:FRE family ferric-chelate reductase [Aspergillus nomiae NRRL 13137]|uniref:FRE family ferric-chelate reductase n=1 Tax=Aspergillus nomiae NRRL (strain ATCC 15546 / NRRL 13137 / CBS 260.88 / M93) TaxID=1509407 RepID=A0A0L1JBH2_ASPN3|nr:FRE family ferric-chelate reductase [Aspergillus nomiae NRRL 13137]KNG89121.1 FRE family ferric-chelate reductase [Aspergillus nomiae NRRL 13137]
MLLQVWVLLVLHTAFTYSKVSPVNERCVTAVYTACGYIPFATSPEAARGFWGSRCQNPWTVTSIYAAADVYCDASERTAGFAQLQSSCLQFGHVDLIPRDALATNLTEDAINQMRRVDYGEIPRSGPVDYPVLLSASFYHRTFRTIDTWEFEVWTHSAYGLAGYLFWAVILSIGVFHRLIQHILLSKRIRVNGNRSVLSRTLYTPFITIYHWIQTYIITSSPLPSRGRYLLWWTFPTRIEAILVVLFWVLSAVLSSVSYRLFPENIYWPQISAQLLRYIADRTGILSFANIPLIWLFAGRNNVFIWATGWSFATFNLFHRHIAWIATIQAVVHTLLYVVLFMQNGNPWKKLVRKPYLIWGTIGMVAMILLCPFAIDWFRRRTYETFLVLHILFSVAALVGCFYHTIIFEDYEYWIWLWPAVGFWAADRLLRVVRLVYYNLHVRTNVGKSIQYTRSSATYDEASDVIRLEVIPGSSRLQPTPGQYYYLYQPFRLTGWENHPFTLGAWSYETGLPTSQKSMPSLAKGDDTVDVTRVPLLSDSSSGSRTPPEDIPSLDKSQRQRLVFWIRPFDGWTRHLRQQCIKSHGRTLDTTILLEGPYGEQFPLWEYESILLIAGGTGIAAASDAHPKYSPGLDESTGGIRPRSCHSRAKFSLARDDFRASFYVTSATAAGGLDECSTLCEELSGKAIEVGHGRPDLQALVLGHAHEAQLSDCSAAVLMCGPPAMADEVRTAVYQTMRQGYQGVRYIEESFSW